jgi:acetyl-CoA carboxylase biotin carboxylase subunit
LKRVLIANRGEIAARIIKTCRRLGIETVAVFSDADRDLPYLEQATVARRIGEPPAAKSYMKIDALIEAAKATGCDAVHPGYGFLSENPAFVRAVEEAGLVFIGPDAEAVRLMGDKIAARAHMKAAGVPVVPGSDRPVTTLAEAAAVADRVGYPVMLKAAAGGGGIGMVRCADREALERAFVATQTRAKTYFGNAALFIEKAIEGGRHIEVQIFGDKSGRVIHLFERECSVQRRHQKVVEEAPAPSLSEATRRAITQAAVRAARAVRYHNAGTVEFIVDADEKFYFLEMNTRLQVEHPITEAITGLDLVEWQVAVADGQPLPLGQDDIRPRGAAVEFRLYAEDPETYYPSPGTIEAWACPDIEGVRVDTGYAAGSPVPPFYDPMIAKVIVHAPDRAAVLQKARRFFTGMTIRGIKTNQALHLKLLSDPRFVAGQYDTSLLNRMAKEK